MRPLAIRIRGHYNQHAPPCNEIGPLCDDIGRQAVLDLGNPVFDPQFAAFQPLQCQLIGGAGGLQCVNRSAQIEVLAAEHFKFDAQHVIVLHRQVGWGIHLVGDSLGA